MGPGDDDFDLTSITLPDDNTAEAILFGKAYTWIKSALWMWDEVEDYLMEKANALDSQIIDRQWCYDVMKNNRYMIFARSAPVNEVDHLKDLFMFGWFLLPYIGANQLPAAVLPVET